MFNFGEKYCISVENYSTNKSISYIKEIDLKTYEYSTTSEMKNAKQLKISKAGEICEVLRKKRKGVSFKVCLFENKK